MNLLMSGLGIQAQGTEATRKTQIIAKIVRTCCFLYRSVIWASINCGLVENYCNFRCSWLRRHSWDMGLREPWVWRNVVRWKSEWRNMMSPGRYATYTHAVILFGILLRNVCCWSNRVLYIPEDCRQSSSYRLVACLKKKLPIGLYDVEDRTLCIQSAYRWRWICQPDASAALCSSETFF